MELGELEGGEGRCDWRHGRWVEMKGDEMKMRGDEIELGKEMIKSNCLFSRFA